jgi:23S rRNA pseudouridine1911/1915/1917 synthase
VPKSECLELGTGERIPILYEDRSVLAIDKPRGWMLAPDSWTETGRNLQAALRAGIEHRDYWARSRNLKFLRFVHRLDAETTGILLLARSPGVVRVLSKLFEGRSVEKVYLAMAHGVPKQQKWFCRLKLAPDPEKRGKMKVDPRHGKEAETDFRLLQSSHNISLIEARPLTGRTHQIRIHLAESNHPIVGDALYGKSHNRTKTGMGLRAVQLAYDDPFTRRRVEIEAPTDLFLKQFGFKGLGV